MGVIMKFHSLLISLLAINFSHLAGTLKSFVVMKGPQGQQLYLFGTDHGSPNPHPGGNHGYVDTLLEVLREAEQTADGGFQVLVEVSSSKNGPQTTRPSLTHIYDHRDEFVKSTFTNLETRTCVLGAYSIFGCMSPDQVMRCFRGPSRDEKESEDYRKVARNSFKCALDEITFEDIYNESHARAAEIKALSDAWRASWSDWSLFVPGASYVLELGPGGIEICRKKLEKEVAVYATSPQEKVLEFFQRMWDEGEAACANRNYDYEKRSELYRRYFKVRTLFQELCSNLGAKIFDPLMFDRVYRCAQKVPHKPILVVAGAAHTFFLKSRLTDYGYTVSHDVNNVVMEPKPHNAVLDPDVFDLFKRALAQTQSHRSQLAYLPCSIL